MEVETMREKKQTLFFSKVISLAVWTMLILTIGSVFLTALMSVI